MSKPQFLTDQKRPKYFQIFYGPSLWVKLSAPETEELWETLSLTLRTHFYTDRFMNKPLDRI